jgi:hypothetical protein
MTHILVGFSTKKNSFISRMICWFSGWRHSHVVLINSDQTRIIESTGMIFQDPEDGELRDGVREVPIAYLEHRDMVEIRAIDHPDPVAVWRHAQSLNGRPYDHEYLGSWVLRRGRGDTNKINCQEVVTESCAAAGHALFPSDAKFLTPRDLYMISKEI